MTVAAPLDTTTPRTPDIDRLNEFVAVFVDDFGAILQAPTVVIGHRLN